MPRKAKKTYETEKEPFPTALRGLIEERKINQKTLAEALGVTRQAISLYATGQSSPDIKLLYKMMDYFNVSADYLLGRTGDPTGDADVMAVEKRLGLKSKTQEKIVDFNDIGGEYYHLKYGLDLLNALILSDYYDILCRELDDYIDNVKFYTLLEKVYPDTDFSARHVSSIVINDDGTSNKQRKKELDGKDKIENERRDNYHNAKKQSRWHYFEAQECFTGFIDAYAKAVIDNFDITAYFDDSEKREQSREKYKQFFDDFISWLKTVKESKV